MSYLQFQRLIPLGFILLTSKLSFANVFEQHNQEQERAHHFVGKIYNMSACTLRPFIRDYIAVAINENDARDKVSRICAQKEGGGSIFCEQKKAKCTQVDVTIPN